VRYNILIMLQLACVIRRQCYMFMIVTFGAVSLLQLTETNVFEPGLVLSCMHAPKQIKHKQISY
jgi:hypothetical protein